MGSVLNRLGATSIDRSGVTWSSSAGRRGGSSSFQILSPISSLENNHYSVLTQINRNNARRHANVLVNVRYRAHDVRFKKQDRAQGDESESFVLRC